MLRAETITGWAADYLSGRGIGSAAPRSGGRPIEIGITVGLRTALGHDDLPGEVPGHGIVPREVIAKMIGNEHAKLRLMGRSRVCSSPRSARSLRSLGSLVLLRTPARLAN